MSDKDIPLEKAQWASEATFLASNNTGDRRQYWKNALEHLRNFIGLIIDETPFVIGLQEINLTADDSDTGSDAITQMLSSTSNISNRFEHICREVFVKKGNTPALSIIYDKIAFGKPNEVRIIDNWCQAGRPLLMVLTEYGYVFANMHGAQNPDDGNPYKSGNRNKFNESLVKMNKRFLENSLKGFLKCERDIRVKDIFITGDFNDRYDAIKSFNVLSQTLEYNGDAPNSCCHNWDSSCQYDDYKHPSKFSKNVGTRDKALDDASQKFWEKHYNNWLDGNRFNDKYCRIPKEITTNDKKHQMEEPDSNISSYRYKGDKVFGKVYPETDDGKIGIFDGDRQDRQDKPSTESDHELVFAKFQFEPTTIEGDVSYIDEKSIVEEEGKGPEKVEEVNVGKGEKEGEGEGEVEGEGEGKAGEEKGDVEKVREEKGEGEVKKEGEEGEVAGGRRRRKTRRPRKNNRKTRHPRKNNRKTRRPRKNNRKTRRHK